MAFLNVCTNLSASPILDRWCGTEEWTCFMPFSSRNHWKVVIILCCFHVIFECLHKPFSLHAEERICLMPFFPETIEKCQEVNQTRYLILVAQIYNDAVVVLLTLMSLIVDSISSSNMSKLYIQFGEHVEANRDSLVI